jgi:hypothetical protein
MELASPCVSENKEVGDSYKSDGYTHAAVAIPLIHIALMMHTCLTNIYGYNCILLHGATTKQVVIAVNWYRLLRRELKPSIVGEFIELSP